MINSLHIKGIQSHKDTWLDFVPGVNVIIGLSGAGKSAIIRALQWAVENTPGGDLLDSLRTKGMNSINVIVKTDDISIERYKSKSDNYYRIIRNGKPEKALRAIGQTVPEEVKSILNLLPVNMQYQMDAPFLLSSTSGEVGRILNKTIGIDKIDTALANINKTIKKETSAIAFNADLADKFKSDLTKFDWLDDAEKELVGIETLATKIDIQTQDIDSLKSILTDIDSIQKDVAETDELLQAETEVNALYDLQEKIQAQEEEIKSLRSLLNTLQEVKSKSQEYSQLLTAEDLVDQLLAIVDEMDEQKVQINRLSEIINEIESTEQRKREYETAIKTIDAKYKRLMPEECPLCGSKTK